MTLPSLPTLSSFARGHLTALAAAACFVLGLALGWGLWHPRGRVVETPAFAVRQRDSSLVLARAPDAHAKPPAEIPKGGTLERVVYVTVQPKARVDTVHDSAVSTPVDSASPRVSTHIDTVRCPPVRVGLALVRMKDQTRRVVASSPDGAIVGGVDIPVESAAPARVLAWALGPTRGTAGQWGGFVSRRLGPLELMVQGDRPTGQGWQGRLGVGLRF